MQIDLSKKEFRRLLDMVYIGNWILNSTRGDDRFADYDDLESKLFALCREQDMEYQPVSNDNYEELVSRMDDYIAEFEAHGTDNILISDMDQP